MPGAFFISCINWFRRLEITEEFMLGGSKSSIFMVDKGLLTNNLWDTAVSLDAICLVKLQIAKVEMFDKRWSDKNFCTKKAREAAEHQWSPRGYVLPSHCATVLPKKAEHRQIILFFKSVIARCPRRNWCLRLEALMATGAINHSSQMRSTAELARQPNYGSTQRFPEEDEMH